jgi:DNA mismatch repair protein MutL
MNRIRLLPEQVASQIAAGEVVERPVSVVKELVENALDAGATHITVEIQAGGRSLIRVTDDGIGMSRDDALLCLERHATSKIRVAEDLHAITTMGFRGEALPSLASVSRLTITTRERESEAVAGTQLVVQGGKIIAVRDAGAPPGTCVEARQLFYNLPARRKFLRREETERAHIQHYLTLAALASPEVAFTFVQDQRLVWQLPALKSDPQPGPPWAALQTRLRALYGSDQGFLRMDFSALLGSGSPGESEAEQCSRPLRIWGFIGAPGLTRATREDQHLFVNRRPVENRGLNFAIVEGYHTALMKGRYPVGCVFVEIYPAEVDVNIHPAKREVKFRQEHTVRQFVTQAVRRALLGLHSPRPPPAQTEAQTASSLPQRVTPQPTPREFPCFSQPSPAVPVGTESAPALHPPAPEIPRRPAPATAIPLAQKPVGEGPDALGPEAPPGPTGDAAAPPLLAVPLRSVGVIGKLYVVLESDRGVVLLDQHAAHERVLYEQMLNRLEQGDAPSQRLLLAETIELPPRDAQFLREQLAILTRLGVGLSEFGERTFLLDALPPFVQVTEARHFVLELVDALKAAGQAVNSWRLGEQTIAKAVCRHAVKAHDPLTGPELEHLLAQLRQCAMPYTCPHGRPTLIELNYRELEKRFGRSQ